MRSARWDDGLGMIGRIIPAEPAPDLGSNTVRPAVGRASPSGRPRQAGPLFRPTAGRSARPPHRGSRASISSARARTRAPSDRRRCARADIARFVSQARPESHRRASRDRRTRVIRAAGRARPGFRYRRSARRSRGSRRRSAETEQITGCSARRRIIEPHSHGTDRSAHAGRGRASRAAILEPGETAAFDIDGSADARVSEASRQPIDDGYKVPFVGSATVQQDHQRCICAALGGPAPNGDHGDSAAPGCETRG